MPRCAAWLAQEVLLALRTAETHRGLYEDLLHITRRFIPKAVDPKQVGTQALHARGKNNPCNCEEGSSGLEMDAYRACLPPSGRMVYHQTRD